MTSAAEAANLDANQAFAAGDAKRAIEGYSRAIGADPKVAKYYGNRANAYISLEKFAKAASDADKAIELDGSVAKFHYRAAVSYFHVGDYAKAEQRVAALLSLEPANVDGLSLKRQIEEKNSEALLNVDVTTAAGAKVAGAAYLKSLDGQAGVYKLPSGLRFRVKQKPTDAAAVSPNISDTCSVHYHGTLVNGDVFDSSYQRGEPTEFAPNQVIKGWTEALQYMGEGEKWEVYLPHDLAYGPRGAGESIPGFSTLIFTIELLKVLDGKGKPAAEAHKNLEEALGVSYDSVSTS